MSLKKIDIEQNSPEWNALRRLHVGASDCPSICGVDPYKKPEKLWKQKFTGEKQYVSPAMERGKTLEPFARQMLEKANGVTYKPIVVRDDEFDFMIASLDGYDPVAQVIIEIKCPGDKMFNQIILDRKIPIHYIYQMQHQMRVTGLSKCLLIPFNGVYFEEIEVDRDEAIINELIAKERHFYQSLIYGEYIPYA